MELKITVELDGDELETLTLDVDAEPTVSVVDSGNE